MAANDPFAAHGIQHLSVSTCNLFTSSPAAFVLFKCLKRANTVGAAAHRGTAVEKGIVFGLETGAGLAECQKVAQDEFWRLTALTSDPAHDKEKIAVPQMVEQGLKELQGYGKPTSTQGEISYSFDEIAVPYKGFYDIRWENHHILTDIKTTHALPSKVSTNHARQVALYVTALGGTDDARVTYITPKKSASYRVENVSEHLEALKRTGMAIQKFLSTSEDPVELASMVTPDVDSFYFKEAATRQAIWEIWGV